MPLARHAAVLVAGSLLLAAPVACSGDGKHSADSAAGATSRSADSSAVSVPAAQGTPVRADSVAGSPDVIAEPLQWTGDAVLSRLREAGLRVASQGAVQPSPLGAPGLRVRVENGAAEVQAYVFGDADAVGNATRSLDVGRLSGPGRSASLSVDNNLAAVILTGDDKLRERIRFALVARRGEGR